MYDFIHTSRHPEHCLLHYSKHYLTMSILIAASSVNVPIQSTNLSPLPIQEFSHTVWGVWGGPLSSAWSIIFRVVHHLLCGPSYSVWSIIFCVVHHILCGPSSSVWSIIFCVVHHLLCDPSSSVWFIIFCVVIYLLCGQYMCQVVHYFQWGLSSSAWSIIFCVVYYVSCCL